MADKEAVFLIVLSLSGFQGTVQSHDFYTSTENHTAEVRSSCCISTEWHIRIIGQRQVSNPVFLSLVVSDMPSKVRFGASILVHLAIKMKAILHLSFQCRLERLARLERLHATEPHLLASY